MPAPPLPPPRPASGPGAADASLLGPPSSGRTIVGLAPTVPPPARLREVADEMAAYASAKSEPPTQTYAPFATRDEFASLLERVAQLELAGGATVSALELQRDEVRTGVERLTAQMRGLKTSYQEEHEKVLETLADVAKQAHETKHAVRNMDQYRVAYAQYQDETNQLFAFEHGKTRRLVRAGNVAKLLVGALVLGLVTNIVPIVTLLARLFGGGH